MGRNLAFRDDRRKRSKRKSLRLECLETRRVLAVLAVPGDFATIQAAIDHARDGDLVQIADGLYEESLDLSQMGSAIAAGTGNLRIQGNSQSVVVRAPEGAALFNSTPFASDLLVEGITFESPSASETTAGIVLADISGQVELRDLLFQNLAGVALRVEQIVGELFVTNNVFEATGGPGRGDALSVTDLSGTGVIHDNWFNDVTGSAIRIEQTGGTVALMLSANVIIGDGSFFQSTGDGIVVSSSGDAQLDLSVDRNEIENLRGRGIDVLVEDQARLQSRWTKNTLQQIRGDTGMRMSVTDVGEAALAVFDNSVLDAFGSGVSLTLEEAGQARAIVRNNLLLAIGDGASDAGLVVGTGVDATGKLTLLVHNNSIDTIAGNGVQLAADGSAAVSVVLTDNFFTGTNTIGGTDAVVLQTAPASTATVQARVAGNQVLDPIAGAYRLSGLGGVLQLAGSSATPAEQLATTNQGEPIDLDGTASLIAANSLDAFVPLLLGDFVWRDENGNGIADVGEPGQAFVRVNLNGTDSEGTAVARSTLADSAGNYYFSALLPGDYVLELPTPLGFRLAPANQGSDDTLDSDLDRATMTVPVALTAAAGDLTLDAGLQPIWQNPSNRFDVNADGFVSPIDALQLINDINENGPRSLPVPFVPAETPPYLDVDGDGSIAPVDVLQVINRLNDAVGEGEAASGIAPLRTAPTETGQRDRTPSAPGRRAEREGFETVPRNMACHTTTIAWPQTDRSRTLGRPSTAALDPQLVDQYVLDGMFADQANLGQRAEGSRTSAR